MIIENEFDVAATPDEVYKLMLDPERVGTCITGAQVTGRREDGSYDANVTVKLGPVKMTYRGTIAIVESDAAARTATMLAKGAEERGQGTAQATLHMAVTEREGGGSHVKVSADMLVTGRVAHDRPDGREHGGVARRRRPARLDGRCRLGGVDAGLGGR